MGPATPIEISAFARAQNIEIATALMTSNTERTMATTSEASQVMGLA